MYYLQIRNITHAFDKLLRVADDNIFLIIHRCRIFVNWSIRLEIYFTEYRFYVQYMEFYSFIIQMKSKPCHDNSHVNNK